MLHFHSFSFSISSHIFIFYFFDFSNFSLFYSFFLFFSFSLHFTIFFPSIFPFFLLYSTPRNLLASFYRSEERIQRNEVKEGQRKRGEVWQVNVESITCHRKYLGHPFIEFSVCQRQSSLTCSPISPTCILNNLIHCVPQRMGSYLYTILQSSPISSTQF